MLRLFSANSSYPSALSAVKDLKELGASYLGRAGALVTNDTFRNVTEKVCHFSLLPIPFESPAGSGRRRLWEIALNPKKMSLAHPGK